ncbi:MAG: PAS domain S-box protein [Deltaproteobacteria bacterium]|nr:PAS domain S-box protein [Deltaproteobacteria bacterium]
MNAFNDKNAPWQPEIVSFVKLILPSAFLFAGLFIISRYNYPLFHGMAELFSIAVAWAVAMLVWNTRRYIDNDALVFLGIVYFFIGFVDMIHTLAFKGMNVFHDLSEANLSTQLWILGRSLESIALLIFPQFLGKHVRLNLVWGSCFAITLFLMSAIFFWDIFPDCYVEGVGLTAFKKGSEYTICVVLLIALVLLYRKRGLLDSGVYRLMMVSILLTIGAELAFTFYVSVYGLSNLIGHFLKIISFYIVLLALVRLRLAQHYGLLFRSLRDSEEKYRTVADHTYAWEYWQAPDLSLPYVSPSCQRLTGYRAEEFQQDPELLVGIVHPDDRDQIERHIHNHENTIKILEHQEIVFRIITRSGEERWLAHVCQSVNGQDGTYLGRRASNRDITELKQTMDALNDSGVFLYTLLNAIPIPVFYKDTDGRYIGVNKSFEEFCGLSNKEVVGKTVFDIFPKELALVYYAKDNELFHLAGTQVLETQLKDGNGIIHDVVFHKATFTDPQGQISGLIGATIDITERKKAEKELREKSEELELFFSNAIDLLCIADTDGCFRRLNVEWEKTLGFRLAELEGRRLLDFVHPDDLAGTLETLAKLGKGQEILNFTNRCRRKDGSYRWVEWRSFPVGKLIYSAARDITERKQMEQALLLSEAKHREAQKIASMGHWELDLVANSFWWSEGACDLFEIDDNSSKISYETFLGYVHPEDREAVNSAYSKSVEMRTPYEIVHRLLMADGRTKWVKEIGRTDYGPNGQPLRSVGTVLDVSSLKLAELETRKLENKLHQAQKMEAIGTLASGIAHDFNNILGAIIGYTQLAILETQEENQLKHFLEQIFQAGQRATDLVKHILSFSRQKEEQQILVDASSIIKEALKLLRASIPSTIEIKQQFASKDSTILADPTSIHQIIMNLCTNASHAMAEKGGILSVALEEAVMESEYLIGPFKLSGGDYIKLSVTDTGTGIPPENIGRIFDPYFTTKGQGEGTGLGLAVIHGIVKNLKGAISVYSELGEGTTFNVFFPKAEKATSTEVPLAKLIEYGTEKILFIDDEPALIDMGKNLLERLGYQVTTMTSSIEALLLFKSNPVDFDLVITDQTMPQMTGMELAKELITVRPDIPIILCTGYSHHVTEKKVLGIGIRRFLLKPLLLHDLACAVREALGADGKNK